MNNRPRIPKYTTRNPMNTRLLVAGLIAFGGCSGLLHWTLFSKLHAVRMESANLTEILTAEEIHWDHEKNPLVAYKQLGIDPPTERQRTPFVIVKREEREDFEDFMEHMDMPPHSSQDSTDSECCH